jgi:hypothetical protein
MSLSSEEPSQTPVESAETPEQPANSGTPVSWAGRWPLFAVISVLLVWVLIVVSGVRFNFFSSDPGSSAPTDFRLPPKIAGAAGDSNGEVAAEKQKVIVTEGTKWETNGYDDFMRGTVKNTAARTVTRCKLTSRYYTAAGSKVDSASLTLSEPLAPGASRKFEIIHKHNLDAPKADVVVEEVDFK